METDLIGEKVEFLHSGKNETGIIRGVVGAFSVGSITMGGFQLLVQLKQKDQKNCRLITVDTRDVKKILPNTKMPVTKTTKREELLDLDE